MRVIATIVCFFSGIAAAQSAMYDFQRQDISVDLAAPTPVIELALTTKVLQSSAYFDFLKPALAIDAFSVNGTTAQPMPHPQYPNEAMRVTFASIPAGDTLEIHMTLKGAFVCRPPGSMSNVCVSSSGGTMLFPVTYTFSWYVVNVYAESDPFQSKITVRVPAGETAVTGQGTGTVEELSDGTRRWTYNLMLPTDSLFLATGAFQSKEASAGNYAFTAYYPPGTTSDMKQQEAAQLGAQLLQTYSKLYTELPGAQAHLITGSREMPAAGIGMLGNVLLAEYAFTTHEYLREQGIAHELAHSWWGNLTHATGDEVGFMNEALAEYSAWRALGEIRGSATRTAGVRMNANWYMYRTPAGQDVAPLAAGVASKPGYVFVTYHKGSVVLRMLEEVAGGDLFATALKGVINRGAGRASIKAVIDEVKQAGGPDLTPEVDRWLRQPGYARIQVSPRQASDGLWWDTQCEGLCPLTLPMQVRFPHAAPSTRKLTIAAGAGSHRVTEGQAIESAELDPQWTAVREVTAARKTDVTLDAVVDGRDLLEVALRVGATLPTVRRVDGSYDALYDVDGDRRIDAADVAAVLSAIP